MKNDSSDEYRDVPPPGMAEGEATEVSRQRLLRRRFLRRSTLVVGGISLAIGGAGALALLYPSLTGQHGSTLDAGLKALFPAATPDVLHLNQAGVFYHEPARAFLIHLAKETSYLIEGKVLLDRLSDEWLTHDSDGSYWLALSRRCTHLGTTVVFYNQCLSFKCPSHGSHFHCDGEYLDGPAPRDMDRFPLSLHDGHVLIDTGRIIRLSRTLDQAGTEHHPRLLIRPPIPCMP